ncbi:MAG: DUF1801 domain-containing protein [Croceibacterium sp.]
MAEAKTKPTQVGVSDFIDGVEPEAKREDGKVLDALFRKVTGVEPAMWGPSIVGYGSYSTVYDSGRSVGMCRAAFSPRKARHSLYLSCGSAAEEAALAPLLARLGKHSRGKGCLYVNKLADIDLGVLEEMVALSWANSFARYPA